MITAVLDTNVLASGFVGFLNPSSTPGRLLHAWRDGRFVVITSEHIRAELEQTLLNPYFIQRLTQEQVAESAALLRSRTTLVEITAQVHGVATHPEDDLTLATAVSAKADYLVTGDKKLQEVGSYQGVTIMSPQEFLKILESRQQD